MPRKDTIEGYTIAVFVPVARYRDADQAFAEAGRAADLIIAHVKPHAGIANFIDIEPQTESTCEFCGNRWTEDDPTFNGGCCAEDAKNEPAHVDMFRVP